MGGVSVGFREFAYTNDQSAQMFCQKIQKVKAREIYN